MTNASKFIEYLYGVDVAGSAERPHEVVKWATKLADHEGKLFWEVVVEVWSDFDRIPHEDFARLFNRFSATKPYTGLMERLTVFRGQSGDAQPGLSWTTKREVAEGFAHGHRGIRVPNPVVLERTISPDEIAFTCHEREEHEVVLLGLPE
ncbi:hypothetical protein [uncultured Maritimibacter sp.]|jgi:hypothetical protein|uniref:hypothetical protein n=1 Tax=uncultured Maritimibacter sp. TaxID=991866 RepID=UPI0026353FB6|nr:hypothetical protein [uncultured Maritimibacter sp.]